MINRGVANGGPPSGVIGAVIYCRVSTKEQVQNLSLDTQRRRCVEYCAQNGWAVRRVFVEEGESAKTANRPQLREMVKFCGENRGLGTHHYQ